MAQEIADSTLLDTWSSGGNIVEPDISKIIEGWQLGEQPPHEYMNWLQNTFGSKLNHILKNGVASWNNETEYLAGSSVQHNGNVWLCKTANTNSAPTDVNVNWKRILTVESLIALLVGYVATTGNQTIAGVKTFNSSPIVPSPTTNTQVANKSYVDTIASTFLRNDTSSHMNGQLYGGMGAIATSGVLDWNNVTNARSGNGYTLLLGNAANGFGLNKYYHTFSFEYGTKDGTGNLTQFAIPYDSTVGDTVWFRSRYDDVWSSWYKFWSSNNDGAGSGLDADLLDGLHSSAFLRDSSLSLNQNGYEILTNGKIECWGVATIGDSTTLNVNFPVSFNTQCFGIKLSLNSDGGITADSFSAYNITNSGFTLKSASNNSTNTIYWEAKGK